jgi:hypothetical protein
MKPEFKLLYLSMIAPVCNSYRFKNKMDQVVHDAYRFGAHFYSPNYKNWKFLYLFLKKHGDQNEIQI